MTTNIFNHEKQDLRDYYVFSEYSMKILDDLIEESRREIFQKESNTNEEQP